MKWVTQERARGDRIAGPWFISHFIDKEATFLFVPADQVRVVAEREGTVPYDISGVELGHHDERCSFDAFLEKFKLTDPALQALARSEERRVGKECRSRWWQDHGKKKTKIRRTRGKDRRTNEGSTCARS